jgi:hypothetical protein
VREGGDADQRRTQSAYHDEEACAPLLSCPAAAEEERARGGAWQGISKWMRRRPVLGRERLLLVVEGAVRCGTGWRDPAVGVLPRQRRDFIGGAPVAERDRRRRRSPRAEEQRRRCFGLLRLHLLVLMHGRGGWAPSPAAVSLLPPANQGDQDGGASSRGRSLLAAKDGCDGGDPRINDDDGGGGAHEAWRRLGWRGGRPWVRGPHATSAFP